MALLLYRLGKFSYRHRWWVLSVWLVILIAVGGAAAAFHGKLTNDFKIPGTETQRVIDHLQKSLPSAAGGNATAVFQTSDGKPFTDAQKTAISDTLKSLKGKDHVNNVVDPFATQAQLDSALSQLADGQKKIDAGRAELATGKTQLATAKTQLDKAIAQQKAAQAAGVQLPADQAAAAAAQIAAAQKQYDDGAAKISATEKQLDQGQAELDLNKRSAEAAAGLRFVSENGQVAVSQLSFDVYLNALEPQQQTDITDKLTSIQKEGLNVYPSKELSENLGSLAGPAEIIGLGIAAIALIVMLGTLVAAGLPLLMAIIGVGVGVGGTFALSGVIEMNTMTPILALMLGLAVGIDYSLFIVTRHRGQYLGGMELEESIGRATGTSGNAVFFAGVTVVITLAALAVPGLPFLTLMGLTAAGTVAIAILVSLTLTPAMIGFLGRKVATKKAWARATTAEHHALTDHPKANRGWGRLVTSHPWLTALGSALLLAVIAIPVTQLRLALPDGGSEPADSSAYKSYALIGESFGEGMNGPILVVGDFKPGLSEADAHVLQLDVADKLRSVPDVVAAVPLALNPDRTTAVFQVIPKEGPASASTERLVTALRGEGATIKQELNVSIGLSGQTAANIDVTNKLDEALPVYLAIVVTLSLILLLLVFRSIWVPVLATVGFLLSLAASFGAIVAVYQWGWLGGVFDVHHTGPILSMLPIILIGVLFGLAMDYQMFIGSGMREAYVHGAKAKHAVRVGFAHAATVVTAAAIIMISVFAGFIFNHLTMVRPIGFALAFGVLLDAFVVRMTLIPAVMTILGKHAWWLPKWLERILPDVDVEGAKLTAIREAADHADHSDGHDGGAAAEEGAQVTHGATATAGETAGVVSEDDSEPASAPATSSNPVLPGGRREARAAERGEQPGLS